MGTIMTASVPVTGEAAMSESEVASLVWALDRMTTTVWEDTPGESLEEKEARRQAAADILDDLLNEYAAGIGGLR